MGQSEEATQPMNKPHYALRVSNLSASVDFYARLLGFTVRERDDAHDLAVMLDPDGDAMLLSGPSVGDLAPYLDEQPYIVKPHEEIGYRGGDLDGLRARWLASGADASAIASAETSWGDRALTITDPDGYRHVFHARKPLSPAETLALYVRGPVALDDALAGLSGSDLDLAPPTNGEGEGEAAWTIRQIVHHIADGDALWATPIKAALATPETRHSQEWYTGNDAIANRFAYATRPVATSLAMFRANRAYIAELIGVVPGAWELRANFVLPGRLDPIGVGEMVHIQATHALEHCDAIRAIRRTHGR